MVYHILIRDVSIKPKPILNMDARRVHLNLSDLDLEAIYDSITPECGVIEVVKMNGKIKHSENISEKNTRYVVMKIKNKQNKQFFHHCIGIYFPTWCLKLFTNGSINAIYFPDEETYENDMSVLFDVLKQQNHAPYVVSQKDILQKNKIDWKLLEHNIENMLKAEGWEKAGNSFVKYVDNKLECNFSYSITQTDSQCHINGLCCNNFDYCYWIDRIVKIFDSRYITSDGRIVVDFENSDKIYVVIIKNNQTKIKKGTF